MKAVELEIQKIEAAQAKRHVQLLTAFLPETFVRRGGMTSTDLIYQSFTAELYDSCFAVQRLNLGARL